MLAFVFRRSAVCLAVAASLGMSLPPSVFAQLAPSVVSVPAGVQQVQTVEGITEYRLPNGLKVLLAPDPADERVTVNITYLVGSRHEGYGETGMAHLLEHLKFKGTPTTLDPKAEFRKRGFDFNGTTNTDRTNYYATFRSNQESLNWYLGWQADSMVNSFIAKKDLDSEMTVVRNEYEQSESNPVQALVARMLGTAYLWHNYGKSTIGAKADIENVDIANLQAFYKRYYRPDNATLIVAGKFDPAVTLATIQSAFGPIAKPAAAIPKTYTVDPVQDGERSVVVRRPAPVQLIAASYHVPPALHPDAAAISVLGNVLSDAPSGRLHKALVEAKLAQGVFAVPFNRTEASTYFFGAALAPTDDAEARSKIVLDIVENLAKNPITAEEFERAKTKLVRATELAFANAAAVANGAISTEVFGDWRAVFVSRDRLKAVTLADVNRVASTYFKRENRTFGTLIPTDKPDRSPEPKLADLSAYMSGFALKAEGESSVAFDFSLPNLERVAVLHTTPGGIKTAVINKPVRGDVVTANFNLKFGDVESLKGQQAAAQFAASLLTHGTSRMTRQQITDAFNALGAKVSFGLGTEGGTVSLVSKKADFAKAFELMAHVLKHATLPDSEFAEVQAAWLRGIEGAMKDPSTQAENDWARYGNPFPQDDVRHAHTLETWLAIGKALRVSDARAFYKRFYGAQNAQFSVIGPVEPAQMQAMVTKEFDGWKAAASYARVPRPLTPLVPIRKTYDTPDKANASIDSRLKVPLKAYDDEAFSLQLATRMFGGGPGSRLWDRMREKDGLTYGASASFSPSIREANADFSMDVDVNPASLSRAEAVLKEELATSLDKGFTQAELDKAKAQLLADRLRGRSGDGFALGQANFQLEYGFAWTLALANDAKFQAVSLEQANAAWRKFIVPSQVAWALFRDPTKAK